MFGWLFVSKRFETFVYTRWKKSSLVFFFFLSWRTEDMRIGGGGCEEGGQAGHPPLQRHAELPPQARGGVIRFPNSAIVFQTLLAFSYVLTL